MALNVSIERRVKGFTLDVQLDAGQGILGVLGASGSGKSMLLRCVAGLVTPTKGRIDLDGQTLYDSSRRVNLPPQRRRACYLFQNYALFPHMTVWDNIASGVAQAALARSERSAKVSQLVEQFQLRELENRYPGQLSGGQSQRVAVARALASAPEALLLDEPFSALDTSLREQMQQELREMVAHYTGTTVMVTHDLREIYHLCKNLAVLEDGRCIAQGETKQLFRNPGLVSVARLTNCRNISRAKPLGERRLWAVDWGVTLETAEPVQAEITAVGIREASFRAAEPGRANRLSIAVDERHEEIDACVVQGRIAGATGGRPLRIRLPKDQVVPEALCVAPEDVLPLRGDVCEWSR